MENVAILVDGAFFIKRALHIFGKLTPDELASKLCSYSEKHLARDRKGERNKLYRIFFYDCPPLQNKVFHPYHQQQIDMAKSERSIWRLQFHDELRKKRKMALRLGRIDDINVTWRINYDKVKKLCSGRLKWHDLKEEDFSMDVKQKGVDMS